MLKRQKTIMSIILVVAIICATGLFAQETQLEDWEQSYYDYAMMLHEMELLRGTNQGLELYKEISRIEAVTILVRLLGGENEAALLASDICPFEDVPEWGVGYVNYAYEHGLTNGTGNGLFGSGEMIDAKSFLTFMLRSLGYQESLGDFAWYDAINSAHEKGVIDDAMYLEVTGTVLTRNQVSKIIFDTLSSDMKIGGVTLGNMLIDQGALDETIAKNYGVRLYEAHEEQADDETDVTDQGEDQGVPNEGTSLVGSTHITQEKLSAFASEKGMNEEGLSLIPIYYEICNAKGLNPVLQYLQMCYETGWMYKNGSQAGLDASYHNPCGLKTTEGGGDYDSSAHMRFDTWYDGIDAHTDHTALYCGLPGYPKAEGETMDPRHFGWLFGRADTVEGLSGKWAPSETYHEAIVRWYEELLAYE